MTVRSVVLALALVPALCLVTQLGDIRVGATPMSGGFPPLAASIFFFGLIAANAVLRRLRAGLALSCAELLFVYTVLFVVSGTPARGMTYFLLGNTTAFHYYATPVNDWGNLFAARIPEWLAPSGDAVTSLYEGLRGGGVPWSAWTVPLAVWAVQYGAIYLGVVCLSSLMERQWLRNERLSFPLVEVPLALTESAHSGDRIGLGAPIFRRWGFWTAVGLTLLVHSWNGLSKYFPAIPQIQLQNHIIERSFTSQPWRSMGLFRLSLFPMMVGLIFLVPAEVSFSCWVFFLVAKAQRVFGAATGLFALRHGAHSAFPFFSEQGQGAYIALFALFLWSGRRHLRRAWRIAWGKEAPAGIAPMRYRSAFIGLGGALLVLTIWSHYSGLTAAFGLAFFVCYFVYCLALTRLVAEGGIVWPLGPLGPQHIFTSILGTRALSPRLMTIAALQWQHVREYRALLMPAVLQGLKVRSALDNRQRGWPAAFYSALGLAVIVSLPLALKLLYPDGALAARGSAEWAFKGFGREPFTRLQRNLANPVGPDGYAMAAMAVGAAVTLALGALRFRFLWWPLHPLGYVFSGSMQRWLYAHSWFSIVLGWLLKVMMLRYGGPRLTRRAQPFFIGLVVGDLLAAGIWTLIDGLAGQRGQPIWAL